ncbi:MAG: hypothetical protein ACFFCY_03815 [Promethearchaeota archaeon]
MYCPECKMNVYTKPNDFNIALAIILAIFTGGIGLLIYLAVYLDKEHKRRCIHCNSVCYEEKENNQLNSNYQVVGSLNQQEQQKIIIKSQKAEEKPIFCYNCGSELDKTGNAKFCALCGTSIQ